MKLYFIHYLILLVLWGGMTVQASSVKIAFWNVENLFDLIDDPKTNDNEFAIGGRKNVTREIYELKLKNLSEVVNAAGADILGLCEIENMFVLEELNRVAKTEYSIVHFDSPDRRGIDVALLFDQSKVSLVVARPISVRLPTGSLTRDILYVETEVDGSILHLFVNHWPSKYGGAEKTIPHRAAAAKTLRKEVESILSSDPKAEIVVMGDLNDEPVDPSVTIHLGTSMSLQEVDNKDTILWNVMEYWHRNENGSTYKYGGKDMVYDHLIVSPGLTDEEGLAVINNSVGIFDGKKYRQHGGKYDGYPFRFWAGNRLLGGYSDHMLIYLEIESK
tara:strand:- start:513 stop:1508 length:996 start_codon:yes stop_codon:yes gene_type:complete